MYKDLYASDDPTQKMLAITLVNNTLSHTKDLLRTFVMAYCVLTERKFENPTEAVLALLDDANQAEFEMSKECCERIKLLTEAIEGNLNNLFEEDFGI